MTPTLPPPHSKFGLIGDIGGTNCRLALAARDGERTRLHAHVTLKNADFPTAEAGLAHYFSSIGARVPDSAVLAVAGPVVHGRADLTNAAWRLDEASLRQALGLQSVRLINDFAVQALATLVLGPADLARIGPPAAGLAGGTFAVMGPGTGFGVSALAGGMDAGLLVTEGGHIGFAPTDDTEIAILRCLAARHGRVSVERILSGQGMADLHAALEEIDGVAPSGQDAAAITLAAAHGDARANATLDRFCAIMGSTAGDLALVFGAQGGVFIAGGIMPRLLHRLDHDAFRARFEDKGRFGPYLRAIPTQVITAEDASLRGAARALFGA